MQDSGEDSDRGRTKLPTKETDGPHFSTTDMGCPKQEDSKLGYPELLNGSFVRHGLTERPRHYEDPPGFVNHGLRRWEEGRAKWLRLGDPARTRGFRRRPAIVDDEVIYDTIFSKPMGWLLPQPVPLAQMVELLEDEWSD